MQAIKSYSVTGIIKTERAELERKAILSKIQEEQDFVDGIEAVYKALLKMQIITGLDI